MKVRRNNDFYLRDSDIANLDAATHDTHEDDSHNIKKSGKSVTVCKNTNSIINLNDTNRINDITNVNSIMDITNVNSIIVSETCSHISTLSNKDSEDSNSNVSEYYSRRSNSLNWSDNSKSINSDYRDYSGSDSEYNSELGSGQSEDNSNSSFSDINDSDEDNGKNLTCHNLM